MVVGTRTTREMVEQGTNMRGPVRWGNVVVAKLVELLWGISSPGSPTSAAPIGLFGATPIGRCGRCSPPQARNFLLDDGGHTKSASVSTEVPVSYHRRLGGESKHSANYWRISRTALRMLWKHLAAPAGWLAHVCHGFGREAA